MSYRELGPLRPTMIDSGTAGCRQALWHQQARQSSGKGAHEPVLFIHGATVPTVMSPAYRISGSSWFDDLANAGFDVWGLDFPGLGLSDPYPSEAHGVPEPPGNAAMNAEDISKAVDWLVREVGTEQLHLVAISRGTIPAGYFAAGNHGRLRSLTLVSPIVVRSSSDKIDQSHLAKRLLGPSGRPTLAYYKMGLQRRLELLVQDRPEGTDPQMDPYVLDNWVADYEKFQRTTASPRRGFRDLSGEVQAGTSLSDGGDDDAAVPGGFAADLYDVWNGQFYDVSAIQTPVLGVRGDYDRQLTTAQDMVKLFGLLAGTPSKRFVTVDRGTHSIQLERVRHQLFDQVRLFLQEHTR